MGRLVFSRRKTRSRLLSVNLTTPCEVSTIFVGLTRLDLQQTIQALVDSRLPPAYAGPIDLHVPRELEAKLTRLAADSGRTVDEVALDLLAGSLTHDEWFRREVEKGRVSG